MSHPPLNPNAVSIATNALQSYYLRAVPLASFDRVLQPYLYAGVAFKVMQHKGDAFKAAVDALCHSFPGINAGGLFNCKAGDSQYWDKPVLIGLSQLVDAFCLARIDEIMDDQARKRNPQTQHTQAAASSSGTGNHHPPAQVDISQSVFESAKTESKERVRNYIRQLIAQPNHASKNAFEVFMVNKFKESFCDKLKSLPGANHDTSNKCMSGTNAPGQGLIWAHVFASQEYINAAHEIRQYAATQFDGNVSTWAPTNDEWTKGTVHFEGPVQNQADILRKFTHIVIPSWAHSSNSNNQTHPALAYAWAKTMLVSMGKVKADDSSKTKWPLLQLPFHSDAYINYPRAFKSRRVIVHYQLPNGNHLRIRIGRRSNDNSNGNNNSVNANVMNEQVKNLLVTLKELVRNKYYPNER